MKLPLNIFSIVIVGLLTNAPFSHAKAGSYRHPERSYIMATLESGGKKAVCKITSARVFVTFSDGSRGDDNGTDQLFPPVEFSQIIDNAAKEDLALVAQAGSGLSIKASLEGRKAFDIFTDSSFRSGPNSDWIRGALPRYCPALK